MLPLALQFSLDSVSIQEKVWIIVVLFVLILLVLVGALRQLRGVTLFDFLFPNMPLDEKSKRDVTPFFKRGFLLFFLMMLGSFIYVFYSIFQSHL